MNKGILIIDFGSQYTQLIARRIREMHVYCEVIPCTESFDGREVEAIILSGGPASVLGEDSPDFDVNWLSQNKPILGICYGMQLLAKLGGGTLRQSKQREYGKSLLCIESQDPLFGDEIPVESQVWMSHGDDVVEVPDDWNIIAKSQDGVIAAISNLQKKQWGVQFHPEVTHTQYGENIIRQFLFDCCKLEANWSMASFVETQVAYIKEKVGSEHVICAMSGGVDSAVTAAILHQAIGSQLHCVFVDNGVLRAGERDAVEREFSELQLNVVDASQIFLERLADVTEPEKKRKIIGHAFIEIFEAEARRLKSEGIEIRWLAQGTLYPDVIESISVRGPAAVIKSHHNVGGLPPDMSFKLIEPLRELFKDEVRQVGLELGLSSNRVFRQPFPGPGLAVRILGEVTADRVALLQAADKIFDQEIREAGLYRKLWQSFVVFLPVKSVGVMGDSRSYEWTVVLRAVHSSDGMTADIAHLPWELLERTSTRIINEVKGINRVAYDISSKPPGTIEWE
ncbi:MAG: glutamine-hydrolyzing GMP synthase [Myxococcota bacterium]